jgi:Mor family transcriptional regulator
VIEREFRLLIEQLTLSSDAFDMLVELAIQSEHASGQMAQKTDLEQQKQAAMAKCQRRIEAAKAVYLDGDMAREEYLKIKEQNEREIAHWQARTTETEQAAVELRMCMNVVNQITELWDSSVDEDRQQMAHMLFEEIVYDLDSWRIVDFRLKPWADRYLVVRVDLFGNDDSSPNASEDQKQNAHLKQMSVLCPIGAYEAQNAPTLEPVARAVACVLARIRALSQPPDPSLSIRDRNHIILARFEAGESQAALARAFDISYQSVHQIIQEKRR